jgi:hypothetical protein
MKKLELLKENAVKAYETGTAEHKAFLEKMWPGEFKPESVFDRIKTWEDVLVDQNENPVSFAKRTQFDSDDEKAYKEAKLITRAMNELKPGEELDPTKPWFEIRWNRESGFGFSDSDCACWCTYSDVGSRLSFKDSQRAIHAAKTFPHIYKRLIIASNTNQ